MSSESAEPPGWLRLGDLAIGDGGVCVTSLIKDKIREYMLNEDQQQTTSAPSATETCKTTSKNGGGETCVRRIGNSLDLLLRESRNAGHAVAATATKMKLSPLQATDSAATNVNSVPDDHTVSTTISAPADSSRPSRVDEQQSTPLPPTFTKCYLTVEDEMQISRMPIPADDCVNSEMSVDTNSSEPKNDVETTTKVNGDCHKKLNGNTVDESMEVDSITPTSEVQSEITLNKVKEEGEEVLENNTESLPNSSDELVKNGTSKEQESEENIENCNQEETSKVNNVILKENEIKKEIKSMEIDEDEDKQTEVVHIKKEKSEILEEQEITKNVVVKVEPQEVLEPEVTDVAQVVEDIVETQKRKQLNTEVSHSDEVIKNSETEINSVNGKTRHSDEEKTTKSVKVKQKVPDDEDMSSEISTDTLSPKQIDEPIARKRSAASHDDISAVSGASSDNDLPKIKKIRSEEDAPLLKDDTRERLIKNIVQSSSKNETELTKNIEKIQNEIKVITEIAQTKRDELVTLIRLQKLKEEIIERLMIKVKEIDAIKTDNSKDWNLPEMFQINLSQPEHILSEKNITDIIENRETIIEKSTINSYDQNIHATSSSSTSIIPVAQASNSQSNDWSLSERTNRANRIQRPILPKPVGKEGRQGPILDVKLIIADHRSKNPETAVPKRGRRKVNANDFSVPTSSAPLRYPNPMGFGNPHHINDGNFKNEVTLHPVSQPMQHQQQQQQQPTSLLHGILTKGTGTHHLPINMPNPPTNYSPTLARLLTAPERCKQSRGKRQAPAATVVSSNTQSRNEITITPVQSTSMSSTYQQKSSVSSNILSTQVDDEDASDRLVIDEGQDVVNVSSPSNAPQCQGCMQKPAQFVCAGCGNQWYCSKDCQIDAWDDHSEVCNG